MDIRDVALKYLGPRVRTCAEVKRHLETKGFESEEIRETLLFLQEYHYIDDEQYAMLYFDYSFGKGRGKRRVKQELQEKGVSGEVVELALEEYTPLQSEQERAYCQAEKVVSGRTIDEKLLAKVGRRLTFLGYSSDVVYKVIGTYRRGTDD